jgi:light-regulated signal transduction histidine kinase (bacteriophytochrome)
MASECPQCRRHSEQFAEFTQIVSHDLQSPVNKIISFLDLLKKNLGQNFDAKSAEYLERIDKNAAALTMLMKKLRDYSHASSLADPIEPADFGQILQAVRENLRPDIEQTGAALEIGPLPTMPARAGQIKILWRNLLSNALTYRADRSPHIQIGAIEQADAWKFFIRDNGPGVRQQDHVKIFQIFPRMEHQAGPSMATGLAIAKKIVENHQGRIWIESTPPDGSTILFTLPRN